MGTKHLPNSVIASNMADDAVDAATIPLIRSLEKQWVAVRTKGEFVLNCYRKDKFDGKHVKRYFLHRIEAYHIAQLLVLAGQFKSIIAFERDPSDQHWVEFQRFSEAKMASEA